jgi:SAM-dependent methyltransferase
MSAACFLCGESLSTATTVSTTARHGESVHTVACSKCGLVQQTARPTEDELALYYAGPYRRLFTRGTVEGEDGKQHAWDSAEAQAALARASEQYAEMVVSRLGLGAESIVLEVGCGDGHFASAMSRHARVVAVDADVEMVRQARARGVDARCASLSKLAEGYAGTADAAISLHVIEHARDPVEALRDLSWLVRKGGKVWVEVPDVEAPYGDLDTHYWQRPHIVCFSAFTLWLALRRAGFRKIELARGDHVLHALAGDIGEELSFEDAVVDFESRTAQRLPSTAEVVEALDAYRVKRRARELDQRAVVALRAFLAGDDGVPPASLREALEVLGVQSVAASKIAQAAITDGVEMCEAFDEVVSEVEIDDEDDWLRGYRAGVASMAARASHMVGHAANRWMLTKVKS